MTPHARRQGVGWSGGARRLSGRWVEFINERFLWLPLGAVLAVLWVNLAPEAYFPFAHRLAFPVNEIGMALFVGFLMHETLEALLPGGALHTWRRWTPAIVAAVGGAVGAALAFFAVVSLRHEAVLAAAWPVACAVDIAAGYYTLRVVLPRRHAATSLLLAIGIVTNAAGLLLLAVWPALTRDHLGGAAMVIGGAGVAALMRHTGVRAMWPYLVGAGTLSWVGFYTAGVHPALALVPVVPFVPRQPRPQELFAEPARDSALYRDEHDWNMAVQPILFLFGLVNAGVVVRGHDTGTWAILAAALLGRPVGILIALAVGISAGLRLPPPLRWRELMVVAAATSSGFTFALFAASALLPVGAVLTQIKVGTLLTAIGAAVTLVIARALHVGRFVPRSSARGQARGRPDQAHTVAHLGPQRS